MNKFKNVTISQFKKFDNMFEVILSYFKNEFVASYQVNINSDRLRDVPEKLQGKDIELNMLLIQDKSLCIYNPFFDIPGSRWDLLDMGMLYEAKEKFILQMLQ